MRGTRKKARFQNVIGILKITILGEITMLKKISIQKRYTNADGEWNSTNSFDVNDLPKLKLVVGEVYRYRNVSMKMRHLLI